ncbi:hypothetical protein IED13_01880 [Bosea sp. SSUT16]|jgi:hypothetical protein|uniref:Uncharacterized protein n=1 Tax=Bosea spartocytisi TaxID=2773451 RepID=A0A927E5F0_9HYPH|nr:hypothetical protein [Bosea spartocytisi]MBD3844432.1 hypothetical protein [Bosea spartocytisi]MCT4470462.1 hypothetical protein [Bosea spartocytisi]
MLPENLTAVVARNESWTGASATEPYEAGWAKEAIVFVRALKEPKGALPKARVEISADGIHWCPEGSEFDLPAAKDAVTFQRLAHFGNFLRVAATLPEGAEITVLVTFHLKA